jgi:hypothetical protein
MIPLYTLGQAPKANPIRPLDYRLHWNNRFLRLPSECVFLVYICHNLVPNLWHEFVCNWGNVDRLERRIRIPDLKDFWLKVDKTMHDYGQKALLDLRRLSWGISQVAERNSIFTLSVVAGFKKFRWNTNTIPYGYFLTPKGRKNVDALVEICVHSDITPSTRRSSIPGSKSWQRNRTKLFYEEMVRDPMEKFRELFDTSALPFDERRQAGFIGNLDTPSGSVSEMRPDTWKDGRNREELSR